jgi:hypothetical protein
MRTTVLLCALSVSGLGCMGELMGGAQPSDEPVAPTPLPTPAPSTAALGTAQAFGPSLLQRLTRDQLVRSTERIFGVALDAATTDLVPFDSPSSTYFDNDAEALSFSLQLITDYERFAWALARQVRTDRAAFTARAGCTPSGADDEACLRRYVGVVSRRAFRRTVTASEQDALVAAFMPFARSDADFFSAVELVVAALTQHPEFLYRVEAGDPQPGTPVALSAHEVATRLAFLSTGLPPDDELLDAADRGVLLSPQGRVTQVQRLLTTRAGIEHGQRFHSKWLGYADRFFPQAIAADALSETNALVEQVVTDPQRDWLTLFTAEETWLTPALAMHYGLSTTGTASWSRGRGGGVLSQATFAALGAKFGDTSPTLRGYETYKRVFCGKLPGDIPEGVDVTMPPGNPSACKPQRYTMRTTVGCQQCHETMDHLGLGLEQVGPYGEWRASEPNNATCSASSEGKVGAQPFTGPAGLGALIAEDPRVSRCAGKQLFESMSGRKTQSTDDATLDALHAQYLETRSYGSLVLALARSPSITVKSSR